MEAANLGAFLAPHEDAELADALALLGEAPGYGSTAGDGSFRHAWLAAAAKVRERLVGRWDADPPALGESLGIPTWYYGAEPPNLFAARSGKYIMNSVREDGLVSIARSGLVFGKGAAGTAQEVFQNANYNYYRGRAVEATPMVFLDPRFWQGAHRDDPAALPILPLVTTLARQAHPSFLTSILASDDPGEILAFLEARNAGRTGPRHVDLRMQCIGSLPPPRRPG